MRGSAAIAPDSAVCVDSFRFQRQGLLRARHGFRWSWNDACPEEILSHLEFELLTANERPSGIHLRHRAAEQGEADGGDYLVPLDWVPSGGAGRWFFLCPHLDAAGEACGRRSRYLVLRRRQRRFGCLKCVQASYPSSRRNHDPVYLDLLKPLEELEEATVELLRCRSRKKRAYLREKAEAARGRICRFSRGPWRKIASRIIKGKASVRDRRRFGELVERLVDREAQRLIERTFTEPQEAGDVAERDVAFPFGQLIEGAAQIRRWEEAAKILRAARRPRNTASFLLSALVTHGIDVWLSAPEEDRGLMAVEKAMVGGDPRAFPTLLRFLGGEVNETLASGPRVGGRPRDRRSVDAVMPPSGADPA